MSVFYRVKMIYVRNCPQLTVISTSTVLLLIKFFFQRLIRSSSSYQGNSISEVLEMKPWDASRKEKKEKSE